MLTELLIIFVMVLPVQASQNIDLTKFITLAEQNDPQYEKIFADQKKAKLLTDQGLPSNAITISFDGEYGSSSDENTSTLTGEISKSFIQTGTELSVSHTKANQSDKEEKTTKVRLEQSLLKNVFGRDIRLKKTMLNQRERLLLTQVEENYENYLSTILITYLNFQKSYLTKQLAQTIFNEAKKLNSDVKKRYQSKIATRTDLARSELLVLSKKEELIEKENALISLELQIQSIIGHDFSKIIPQQNNGLIPLLEKHATISANKKVRPLEISDLQEEISKKEMTLAGRDLYPNFNLVAGYNKDDSERYSSVVNQNETIIGVNIAIPLGDSQKKANAKILAIEHYKEQLTKRKTAVEIKRSSNDLKEKMLKLKRIVIVSDKKIDLTKKILRDEEKRYSIGKIDLETLIEIKNSYAQYRLEHQSNKLEYTKALIQWLDLSDNLIHLRKKLTSPPQ